MLVLSRKVNQDILIGNDITLTIVAIRGKQVRLGIKAPRDVSIRRENPPLETAVEAQAEEVAR